MAKVAKKAAKKTVKRKTTKAKPTAKKKTAAKPKTKRKSGLAQMFYTVSPELQAIVGAKRLTRPEIVKKLWVYIKAHKCQDMKNRRMINPDQKLSEVLGKKTFTGSRNTDSNNDMWLRSNRRFHI